MKKKLNLVCRAGVSLVCITASDVFAAGCVVARGAGMPTSALAMHHGSAQDSDGSMSGPQLTIAYRAFTSDRHFVGTDEQEERREEGSEVINDSQFIDIALSFELSDRYSMSITLPFAWHDRSSTVRDSNRVILQRYHTQSAGFGDIQVVGTRWMFDPSQSSEGNLSLGLGIDIPTGKEDTRDTFMAYNADSGLIVAQERNVDQSIQLGDGGWGLITNLNSYYKFSSKFVGYFDGTYTITPEETNGVLTSRSNPYEAEMSIADTYLARTGVDYLAVEKFNLILSLGARMEGVMVKDLIGGDDGFRRPGYDVSIEPGVSLMLDSWKMDLYVPVSVVRNRRRSVADERLSADTGIHRHGDAAFSDYSVTFAVSKLM